MSLAHPVSKVFTLNKLFIALNFLLTSEFLPFKDYFNPWQILPTTDGMNHLYLWVIISSFMIPLIHIKIWITNNHPDSSLITFIGSCILSQCLYILFAEIFYVTFSPEARSMSGLSHMISWCLSGFMIMIVLFIDVAILLISLYAPNICNCFEKEKEQ